MESKYPSIFFLSIDMGKMQIWNTIIYECSMIAFFFEMHLYCLWPLVFIVQFKDIMLMLKNTRLKFPTCTPG